MAGTAQLQQLSAPPPTSVTRRTVPNVGEPNGSGSHCQPLQRRSSPTDRRTASRSCPRSFSIVHEGLALWRRFITTALTANNAA